MELVKSLLNFQVGFLLLEFRLRHDVLLRRTEKDMAENNVADESRNAVQPTLPPPDPCLLQMHLIRQAKIMRLALKSNDTDSPINFLESGEELEKFLFCPNERPQNGDPNPHFNFYPPFLIPECLAMHFPFFLSMPIPMSCKANRTNTQTYLDWKATDFLVDYPSLEKCKWDDSLGKVDLIEELKENQKIVLIEGDSERLTWVKSKANKFSTFAYPSLNLPPSIQKLLLETFIGDIQLPNNLDKKYQPAITEDILKKAGFDPENLKEITDKLTLSITYGITVECIKRLFNAQTFIKNTQEVLHYMFCHGFVKMIHFLTESNLSDFVTFHGLTHRNRLNNPFQHTQLAYDDKFDYMIDSIYLFLVLTWQTAMDIWTQAIDDKTLSSIKQSLNDQFVEILSSSSNDIIKKITDIIFPNILVDTFSLNLPDFMNQMQINNFRTFICSKSGIPQSICPLLPSDLVPLSFYESHPILWTHVFLINHASFLLSHGNYMLAPEQPITVTSCLCECNLCSPHRMPCYNTPLMNEVLSINNFELQKGNENETTTRFTPQIFANAYLKHFIKEDFFHDKIIHYCDEPIKFSQVKSCVIKDEKLLAKLREIQIRRELEILKRGSGLYIDPETGEPLQAVEAPSSTDNGSGSSSVQASYEVSSKLLGGSPRESGWGAVKQRRGGSRGGRGVRGRHTK